MSEILMVYPINEDLRFIRKLIRELSRFWSVDNTKHKLSDDDRSHLLALQAMARLPNESLVCFFGHGATRALHGCQYRTHFFSHDRRYSYQERHGYLIDKSNVDIFRNKKVFCLACDSDTLGTLAIEAGAKFFIGFSTIDFDIRGVANDQIPRNSVATKTKFSLRKAVALALILGINYGLIAREVVNVLKIALDKESDDLILERKKSPGFRKYYLSAANCLQKIKSGIRLFGDGGILFHE